MSEKNGRTGALQGAGRACCTNQTRSQLLGADVPEGERARRARVLAQLDQKVAREGPHRARRTAERAAQFIPYKSLVGLEELLAEEERRQERRWQAAQEGVDPGSDIGAGLDIGTGLDIGARAGLDARAGPGLGTRAATGLGDPFGQQV